MRKYPEDIVEFGFVDQYDTGSRERHNQILKRAFSLTNRKHADVTQQVSSGLGAVWVD
jgi:hypothetical protein